MSEILVEPKITKELKGIEFDAWDYRVTVTPVEEYEQRKTELEAYLVYTKKFLQKETSETIRDIEKRIERLTVIINAKRAYKPVQ